MRHDAATHLRVDALEITNLRQLLVQIAEGCRARGAKRVVLQECIAVEQVDLFDRRLRYQIKHVPAGASSPTIAIRLAASLSEMPVISARLVAVST